ncbi:MAG: nucleotidyltransferase substrate binding protein [Deltaproteobacteria bacterium]|nr:nucleotidyltransferase substrate binding protein [Deltaproteobacteria bacterium]
MEEKEEQFALRLSQLKQALCTLEEALAQPYSSFVRDSVIKRFEYCLELTWKILKRALELEAVLSPSPKQVFRDSVQVGWIDETELEQWFEYLSYRNNTAHTYNVMVADEVYETAKKFVHSLSILIQKIEP